MHRSGSTAFSLHKNPYHLFNEVMLKTNQRRLQQENADLIKIGHGPFSTLLQQDYIDIGGERERRIHGPRIGMINKILEPFTGIKNLDILHIPEHRDRLRELIGYKYPDDGERNQDIYSAFRGIWQIFYHSTLHDHQSAQEQYVRAAALVFYGFVSGRGRKAQQEDPGVKLLFIGKDTVWGARAWSWIGQDKLYVHARETVRPEDKFFIFDAPGIHDPFLRKGITEMRGAILGTALDRAFNRDYPTMALPCIARKLAGWSQWFELNDDVVDQNSASFIRTNMKIDYYTLGELTRLSHSMNTADGVFNEQARSEEFFYKLNELLSKICQPRSAALIKPIVF